MALMTFAQAREKARAYLRQPSMRERIEAQRRRGIEAWEAMLRGQAPQPAPVPAAPPPEADIDITHYMTPEQRALARARPR